MRAAVQVIVAHVLRAKGTILQKGDLPTRAEEIQKPQPLVLVFGQPRWRWWRRACWPRRGRRRGRWHGRRLGVRLRRRALLLPRRLGPRRVRWRRWPWGLRRRCLALLLARALGLWRRRWRPLACCSRASASPPRLAEAASTGGLASGFAGGREKCFCFSSIMSLADFRKAASSSASGSESGSCGVSSK